MYVRIKLKFKQIKELVMAKIKSFSTNNGDMFYINHNSDNFTIIDCCIDEENKKSILKEIKKEREGKNITRLISTHPHEDHIRGLKFLCDNILIPNFYCVANKIKQENETDDFKKYRELRDSDIFFEIYKNCSRKWMNISSDERGSSGINIKWPDTSNSDYINALYDAENGIKTNNISPIITYTISNSVSIYWFGDLETSFMEKIKDDVDWIEADVIFAPHHGRSSGRIPSDILEKIKPKIIIIGEAPSENLDYYTGYETITQNTAENIVIICEDNNTLDFYVSNPNYKTTPSNLKMIYGKNLTNYTYIGSLEHGE